MSKADDLKNKVAIPQGGEKEVTEAVHSRIKTKYKSGKRGARNTKISVLVPESLYQEARLLARVKDRSIGDMINEFLEDQVRANMDDIEALKEINDRNAQD